MTGNFVKNLISKFNIRDDSASPEEIRNRIASASRTSGTNLWVLFAAILIASIGLNMDSTAVIIGAMLISPLMGSIIGIGYGLATKQSGFTKSSLEGLFRQVGIALVASTLYFLISPITVPGKEILARTSPTVWDALIALFGGAAGIIGQTRTEKSNNIIPGVAIATALMPPLCTVGFGIANGKFLLAAGALDLFLVNCMCIFGTTFLFTKLLKLDDTPDDMTNSKKHLVTAAVIAVLVLIPTGWFAYSMVANQAQESKISAYIEACFSYENTQVITHSYNRETGILTVAVVGEPLDENEISVLRESLDSYGLTDTVLKVSQTNLEGAVSEEQVDDIVSRRLKDLVDEIAKLREDNENLKQEVEGLHSENEQMASALDALLPTATDADAVPSVEQTITDTVN